MRELYIITSARENKEMIKIKGGMIVPVGDIYAIVKAIEFIQNPIKRKEISI